MGGAPPRLNTLLFYMLRIPWMGCDTVSVVQLRGKERERECRCVCFRMSTATWRSLAPSQPTSESI